MIFCVFIFTFLFRTNGTKGLLNETNFSHCYGNFFECANLKVTWLRLCLKFFLMNYEVHWQEHFERQPTDQDFTDMDQQKLFQKMPGKLSVAEKSKHPLWRAFHNISLVFMYVFFSQKRLVFKLNLVLIGILDKFPCN